MRMEDRVKQAHSRARIRRWEFRQRNLARGAWHKFRLALAEARSAYAIGDSELAELIAEGFESDDRGRGLLPEKQLIWISEQRARQLHQARELEMHLDAAMLGAPIIALVRFGA